jgi:hypothetical protein
MVTLLAPAAKPAPAAAGRLSALSGTNTVVVQGLTSALAVSQGYAWSTARPASVLTAAPKPAPAALGVVP